MKSVGFKSAIVAVLFMPLLALPGCPGPLSPSTTLSGCMQQAIDAHVVNAGNFEQYRALCAAANARAF